MIRALALACVLVPAVAVAQEDLPAPWVAHDLPERFGQLYGLACADHDVFARSWQGRTARFDGESWRALGSRRLHVGSNLWASPDGATLFITNEGGIARFADGAWTTVEAPIGPTYTEQILSFDGEHAIAVGRGRIVAWAGDRYAAFDGGTWRDLVAIAGRAEDDFWVGGDRGTVLHFDGRRLAPRRIPAQGRVVHLHVDGDEAWAALEHPAGVYQWTDGAWHDRTGSLRDTWITAVGGAPDHVYAVGNFGVVRWDADAREWRDVLRLEVEPYGGLPRFTSVCATEDRIAVAAEAARVWVRPR